MALSRIKTWAAGEILTAADLNAEYNNILNNALSLFSPLTGNLDADGNEIILDDDGDSSITADSDDRIDLRLGGTDIFRFRTVASAVNGLDFYGSATGNQPYIRSVGTDSNFGFDLRDSNGNEIAIFDGVASAVNELTITNAATGNPPIIGSSGETNVGINITPAGTGDTTITTGDLTLTSGDLILTSGDLTLTSGNLIMTAGAINEDKGADIASATTTDIGAATGNYVEVTGSTTIIGFGTVQAGTRRVVRFADASPPLLTYNATSLILPGDADIQTETGDVATFISLGSGNWICTNYQRDSSNIVRGEETAENASDVNFTGSFASVAATSSVAVKTGDIIYGFGVAEASLSAAGIMRLSLECSASLTAIAVGYTYTATGQEQIVAEWDRTTTAALGHQISGQWRVTGDGNVSMTLRASTDAAATNTVAANKGQCHMVILKGTAYV